MIRKVNYTLKDLQDASDEELVSLIYNKSMELDLETFGENFEIADQIMTDFYSIWILESEVHNGGFDQFFLNNGIKYGKTAIEGLSKINADKYAIVCKKAIEVFKSQDVKYENERNPEFNKLDDEFYDLEGLEQLQIKYIRNNYSKFLVT